MTETASPRAYRHAGRGEGQIPQGSQDLAVPTQEDDGHVDSHLCHCALEAAVPDARAQQGQGTGHEGGCEVSDIPMRKDLALLDEFVESLTLLAGEQVEKHIKEDNEVKSDAGSAVSPTSDPDAYEV